MISLIAEFQEGKNEVSPLGEPLILNCVEFLILPPSDPSFGDHGTFQSNFPCSLIPCEIPLHSLLQSDKERHCWLPPQISFQFLRIDGISEIMSWPIVNKDLTLLLLSKWQRNLEKENELLPFCRIPANVIFLHLCLKNKFKKDSKRSTVKSWSSLNLFNYLPRRMEMKLFKPFNRVPALIITIRMKKMTSR